MHHDLIGLEPKERARVRIDHSYEALPGRQTSEDRKTGVCGLERHAFWENKAMTSSRCQRVDMESDYQMHEMYVKRVRDVVYAIYEVQEQGTKKKWDTVVNITTPRPPCCDGCRSPIRVGLDQ